MKSTRIFLPKMGFALLCLLIPAFSWSGELGDELMTGGDMEVGDSWYPMNCGNQTVPEKMEFVSEQKHGGESSLHVLIKPVNVHDWAHITSNLFHLDEGAEVAISFWYKIVKGELAVKMRNGGNNDYISVAKALKGDGDWQYFEGKYRETVGGKYARICFMAEGGEECEMYLDDVSIRLVLPE